MLSKRYEKPLKLLFTLKMLATDSPVEVSGNFNLTCADSTDTRRKYLSVAEVENISATYAAKNRIHFSLAIYSAFIELIWIALNRS